MVKAGGISLCHETREWGGSEMGEDNMANIDHLKVLVSRRERLMLRMELSKDKNISASVVDVDSFLGRMVDVIGKIVERLEIGKEEGLY